MRFKLPLNSFVFACSLLLGVSICFLTSNSASAAIPSSGASSPPCANYDFWGQWGNTDNGLAGLIISAHIEEGGAFKGWINGISWRVDDVTAAHGTPQEGGGAIIHYSGGSARNTTKTSQINEGVNCGPAGGGPTNFDGHTVFGAGSDVNYGNGWGLDCRQAGGVPNWFRIGVAPGVPPGGNSAGHWEYKWEGGSWLVGNQPPDVDGNFLVNGTRHRIDFKWVQPSAPVGDPSRANLNLVVSGPSSVTLDANIGSHDVGNCFKTITVNGVRLCQSNPGLNIGHLHGGVNGKDTHLRAPGTVVEGGKTWSFSGWSKSGSLEGFGSGNDFYDLLVRSGDSATVTAIYSCTSGCAVASPCFPSASVNGIPATSVGVKIYVTTNDTVSLQWSFSNSVARKAFHETYTYPPPPKFWVIQPIPVFG